MSKNFLILIGGLIVLYIFQLKAVTPFLQSVASSGLFLEDNDYEGGATTSSGILSGFAYSHCNHYIREEIDEGVNLNFATTPFNSWDIGNNSFVVNSEVEIIPQDKPAEFKKYVCRISYDGGTDSDYDDWSIYGVSGLDL